MTLPELLSILGLEMTLEFNAEGYGPGQPNALYLAKIKNVDIKEFASSSVVGGASGWGSSTSGALNDLTNHIRGKHGQIRMNGKKIHEFQIPKTLTSGE